MDNYPTAEDRAEETAEYAWRMFLDHCDANGKNPYANGAFARWMRKGRP